MTTPTVSEEIAPLDFDLVCSWGLIVQPYIDGCSQKPVWGVECPTCDEMWGTSCQRHRDFSFIASGAYQCMQCGKIRKAADMKWCKL
jgi:hypothetical protein